MRKLIPILAFVILSCKSKTSENPENVLVKVGDIYITQEDIDLGLKGLPMNLSSTQKEAIKEELVRTAVFYLEAMNEKYDTISELKRKIEWMKRSIVAQEFLMRKYGNRVITPQQAQDFIKKNVRKFSKKATLTMVMYFDSTLTDELKDLLEDDSPFAQRKLMDYARRGMINIQPIPNVNLGLFSLDFPEELVNAIIEKRRGILGPFKLQNAFVIVKVVEFSEDDPNRQEVLQNVIAYLQMKDQQRFMDSLYNALKGKYLK